MNEPVLLSQIFLTGDCWQEAGIENKFYGRSSPKTPETSSFKSNHMNKTKK